MDSRWRMWTALNYLGAKITKHGGAADDIKCRLGKARGAFNKLVKIWRSGQLSKNTKIRIFKSNVIAVLLYGCETWRITKRDERKLDTFLHKCLRRILGIYWPMRVSNEEVWRRARTCTISEQTRRRRWRLDCDVFVATTLTFLRKQRKCASSSKHAVIPIQLSSTANTVHSQSIRNRHHFRHTTN